MNNPIQSDPDLFAIRRKRLQERRCLACNIKVPRAALCKTCRATLRYCPRCEAVYPAAVASQRSTAGGRTTAYCVPCGNAVRNKRGRTRAQYLAALRGAEHPLLPKTRKLYRQGLTYVAIADTLGIPRGTLRSIVAHARKTGRWPKNLQRTTRARTP